MCSKIKISLYLENVNFYRKYKHISLRIYFDEENYYYFEFNLIIILKGVNKLTEADLMRKEGLLFTKKQYNRCLCFIIVYSIVSGLVTFSGAITAIVTENPNIVITGLIIGIVGFIMQLISVIIAFKFSVKIQIYRHYKKYPEDFETIIDKNN